MIQFISIQLEGFRSWVQQAHLDLTYPGITLLTGSNGAGKSSLVEALYWALYGASLRGGEVTTRPQDRGSDFKGTMVEVLLLVDDKAVSVTRYKGYKTGRLGHKSPLVVTVDGQEWAVESKTDAQAQLVALLGLDATSFRHAVLLPQRSTSLLKAKGVEQRQALDAFFSLDWLVAAKVRVEEQLRPLSEERARRSARLATLTQELAVKRALLESKAERFALDLTQFKETKQQLEQKLSVCIQETNVARVRLEKARQAEEGLQVPRFNNKLQDRYGEAQATVSRLRSEKAHIETQLQLVRSVEVVTKCPTCGAPVDSEKARLSIEEDYVEKTKLLAIKEDLLYQALVEEAEIQQAIEAQEQERAAYNKAEEVRREAFTAEGLYQHALRQQTEVAERLSLLMEPTFNRTEMLAEIVSLENVWDFEKMAFEDLETRMEVLRWWSATGFGAKGLREYALTRLLSQVNGRLTRYTGTLGLRVRLSFEKGEVATVVQTDDGQLLEYDDLSGGEQQRLELALTLAMHDCLGDQRPVSVLFLDEPMANVDDEGTYEVFELLRQKKGSLFLMTHTAADLLNVRQVRVTRDEDGSRFA